MQSVSRFEANLLRLLYYFLGREPAERALPLVENRLPPPPCLSRVAVRLVQDTLAKGCTFLLAHRGGWRRERHLRGDKVVEGRLWERTPPADLGLSFSRHTLEFLMWITAARPGDREPPWHPEEEALTDGDRLLLYFAHEGLRAGAESLGAPDLRTRPPFAAHGLCWLAYPEDFAAAPADARPNFAPWTNGLGACMLEAMQPVLAARWIEVEGTKEGLRDAEAMRGLGQAQDRVLTAFLDTVELAGRLDLARFLLQAASALLGPFAHVGMWTGSLVLSGQRLIDRTNTYQAALAFLRHLDRLRAWERRARGVGYFDEGYAASQLWKADWDHYQGDALHQRAQELVRQIDPMRSEAAPGREPGA
jgi:hypothetical protein